MGRDRGAGRGQRLASLPTHAGPSAGQPADLSRLQGGAGGSERVAAGRGTLPPAPRPSCCPGRRQAHGEATADLGRVLPALVGKPPGGRERRHLAPQHQPHTHVQRLRRGSGQGFSCSATASTL